MPELPAQRTPVPSSAPSGNHQGSLIGGAFLGFAVNIGGCIAALLVATLFMGIAEPLSVPFFAIPLGVGLGQWLWLYPLRRMLLRKGLSETAKGLLVAGAITFLLNAACWGMLAVSPLDFK
jgi:hypothetical protein